MGGHEPDPTRFGGRDDDPNRFEGGRSITRNAKVVQVEVRAQDPDGNQRVHFVVGLCCGTRAKELSTSIALDHYGRRYEGGFRAIMASVEPRATTNEVGH